MPTIRLQFPKFCTENALRLWVIWFKAVICLCKNSTKVKSGVKLHRCVSRTAVSREKRSPPSCANSASDTHRHRQTDRQTDRHTQTQTDRHRPIVNGKSDSSSSSQWDRQTLSDRQRHTVWVKKVAPQKKLFAIFSLVVNLCNWKLLWLLPKHISMFTPILVYLSEYLYELYHFH